jgi:hypothetical protein
VNDQPNRADLDAKRISAAWLAPDQSRIRIRGARSLPAVNLEVVDGQLGVDGRRVPRFALTRGRQVERAHGGSAGEIAARAALSPTLPPSSGLALPLGRLARR